MFGKKNVNVLVTVQGGTFNQMSNEDKEYFNHTITSFQIAKYKVSSELWYKVKTWAQSKGFNIPYIGNEGNRGSYTSRKFEPLTRVSWRDAIVWCNAYSEMEGLTPVYTYNSEVIKDSGDSNSKACDNAKCNWSNNGYRLPTEGEWVYAASYIDGKIWLSLNYTTGAVVNHESEEAAKNVELYYENVGHNMANAGTKKPNALGIYDMSSNIWEWCWDWYGKYPSDAKKNFRGATDGFYRILHGGSWYYGSGTLRVWLPRNEKPGYRNEFFGFRVARSI